MTDDVTGRTLSKTSESTNMSDLSSNTIRRVSWRVLPLVLFGFFLAYLDRTNVSMAALTMSGDLGFTATMFGMGSSIFFLGYILFEVPSNMALQRFGPRIWFGRIMFTWGLFAVGMAFVWNNYSFYIGRLLLGIAEAGFYPGLMLYFTYWFPTEYRTRMIGILLVGNPLSAMIGAPLGGLLLQLNGVWGLTGWQWLFISEGIPTLVLSVIILFFLPERPAKASWLNSKERDALERVLERERAYLATIRTDSIKAVLLNIK
ncbi:MAG: MFS transporter, partial [Rhodospirillales bacterium]|nr:MFS transporter [Rhodospirillales bacterium]